MGTEYPNIGAHPGTGGLLEAVLAALTMTGICYLCYFLIAPWIWAQNMAFRPEDITAWVLPSTKEHDGIEVYALYIMSFIICAGALALSLVQGRLAGLPAHRWILGTAGLFCAACYLQIGFTPPMNTLDEISLGSCLKQTLVIALVTGLATGALWYVHDRSSRLGYLLGALLLLPASFLAASAFGWRDYTYIFAPALRLLNGAPPSQIYFQYDLLPSLLAAAWMKLGLELKDFRVLGQAGYYVALLAVFVVSSRLFRRRELAALLLIALILVRLYASPYDPTLTFQTTPVRLDLWISLLLVVYRMGPLHWSAGLTCGLLVVCIKNFGIIYSLAYLQLLLTLWGLEHFCGGAGMPLWQSLWNFARRCAASLALLCVCAVASFSLFYNAEYGNFAGYYQKLGIGFIQISPQSFCWYIFPIFGTVLILLFRMREHLAADYRNAGFLLTYLAIGNSIYFFGRSHEHNILNIAIVLMFLFFFLLDLMTRLLETTVSSGDHPPASFLHRHGARIASLALIVAIIVYYSKNVAARGGIQLNNLVNGKLTYQTFTIPAQFYRYIDRIKQVTDNSNKVYFVEEQDFAFYYYGGYAPSGYCNPFLTWLFTKDLHRYLQQLLDDGYYLVCSPDLKYLLKDLNYSSGTLVGNTTVASKVSRQAPK